MGLGHIAGKTGTTNDYRDAWFIGYSPDLLTASWVGFDDGTPLRISSAEAALPIWTAFMVKAPHERSDLAPPDGVRVVAIEPASGLLWASGCGHRFEEVFLEGTEPEERCRGRVQRPPLLIEFEEPPVISEETFEEWVTETPDMESVQIIIEPGPHPTPQGDDPDVLDEREREEVDRQVEEAIRRIEEMRREAQKEIEERIREAEKEKRDSEREDDDEDEEERDDPGEL